MRELVVSAWDVEEEAKLAQIAGSVTVPHELERMTAGQLLQGLTNQFQQRLSKQLDQKGLPFALGAPIEQLRVKDRLQGRGEQL